MFNTTNGERKCPTYNSQKIIKFYKGTPTSGWKCELRPQAAQAPGVRWSSCETRTMVKIYELNCMGIFMIAHGNTKIP